VFQYGKSALYILDICIRDAVLDILDGKWLFGRKEKGFNNQLQ
jgi:hypothetical protein